MRRSTRILGAAVLAGAAIGLGLRSTVSDTHSGYTTTTVLRAYGIG